MPPGSHHVLAILGISVRSCAPLGPLTQPRPSLGKWGFPLSQPHKSLLDPVSDDLLSGRSHVSSCLRSTRRSHSRNSLVFLAPGATSFFLFFNFKTLFRFCTPYSITVAVHLTPLPSSPKPTFPRVLGCARQMRGQCHTLRSTLFRNIAN
jgi:hypothetical protein